MKLTLTTPAAVLAAESTAAGLQLHVSETTGHDAAITLGAEDRAALAAFLLGSPQLPAVPDGLSPAAAAIAAHFARGFEALADLAKQRGAETDVILRTFVRHVANWRGYLLLPEAA